MATSKPKPSTPEDYTTLLDKLRQWAATPKGAPAQPAYNPLPTTPAKYNPLPTTPVTKKQTPAKSTPAKSTTPAKTQTKAQAPAQPLTMERTVKLQRGQLQPWMTSRPLYTAAGMESLKGDNILSAEDARRQRVEAGGYPALMEKGYVPWKRQEAAVTPVTAQDVQLAPVAAQMAGVSAQPASNQRVIPTTDEGKLQAAREIVNQYTGADTAAMEYDGLFNTLSTYQPSQEIFPQYMNDILWLSTILEQ